jgi:GTP-binding protein HflX
MLVAAFRATLEEVIEADLVLHVRDIAHAETDAQARDVETVLADLGIAPCSADSHILEVWNKIDLLAPEARQAAEAEARFAERRPVLVSAVTGEGLATLSRMIDARLGRADVVLDVVVPAAEGRLLSWLYENTDVLARETDEEGASRVQVRIAGEKRPRLDAALKRAGLSGAG